MYLRKEMRKFVSIFIVLVVAQWWFTDPTVDTPTNDISFNYVVKYTGNANKADHLPMLVALHGNGGTPEDFYEAAMDQFEIPMRIILLEGTIPSRFGKAWPWIPEELEKIGLAVNEAIELLAQKYPTSKKPVLLGFSGGGMMAYYQALKFGGSYSYIFPVSGRLDKNLVDTSSFNTGAPVIAYHGKNDKVVPLNGGVAASSLLRENGAEVEFNEFPGGHHGLYYEMQSDITQAIEQKMKTSLTWAD